MTALPAFSLKQIAFPAFAPSVLYGVAEGAVMPVIVFSARDLGASPALAGFIVTLVGIGSLLNNLPAAALTTRFGERRAMIAAALVAVLGYAGCMLAGNVWLLGLAVLIQGMAGAVFILARQTWLIAAVPFSMRARALSTLAGSMRIGLFAGPFLGALLVHVLGLSGAYTAAILAMIALIAIVWKLPELPGTTGRRGHGTATTGTPSSAGFMALLRTHARVLMTLGTGIMLITAIRASRPVAIPLWGDALGIAPAATSVVYGLGALVDMAVFYPSGKVMDRHGRKAVAVPCALIMALALILTPWTTGYAGFLAVTLLLGFGNGIGSGIVMTLGADASPTADRTRFLGIWRTIADLGVTGGPLLLSAVTAALSLAAGITTIGGLGLVAALIFWSRLPSKTVDPDNSGTSNPPSPP